LTLNNDTVATDDFLEKMIYWAERTPNALLGALALAAETKSPVYGGEIINWRKQKCINLLEQLKPEEQFKLHEVTHFPGRGLLIPSKVFYKIGFFEEKIFPHYIADYDFTHHAIKAGFKIFCNYDAKLMIYPESSGNFENRKKISIRNYYNHLFSLKGGGNLKNLLLYSIRNCPPKDLFFYLPKAFLSNILGYWK
jgi:GT2 family glycosyltransferase